MNYYMTRSKASQTKRQTTSTTMGRSFKRIKRNNFPTASAIIDYLPLEVMTEVLARVGASSPVDLHNCKLSCKVLREVAEDKQVLKQVSLERLPFYTWLKADEAKNFFNKCQESENSEALFQLGMVQYFSEKMMEEGTLNLEKAARQEHTGAAYVLGIIFLCSGYDDLEKRGISLIMSTMKAHKGRGIVQCRRKLRDTMAVIWMKNSLILESRPNFTCTTQGQHEPSCGWYESDDYNEEWEDRVVCETCRCSREISFFYKWLPREF